MKIDLNNFSIQNQRNDSIDSRLIDSTGSFPSPFLGYKTTRCERWTVSDYARAFFGRVFTGGLYTYRHWAMAQRTEDWKEALCHRLLGAVEVIPVVGSVVAVVERRFWETVSGEAVSPHDNQHSAYSEFQDGCKGGDSHTRIEYGDPVKLSGTIKFEQEFERLEARNFFKLFRIEYDSLDASIKAPKGSAIKITKENGIITVSDSKIAINQNLFSIHENGDLICAPGKLEYIKKLVDRTVYNPYQ